MARRGTKWGALSSTRRSAHKFPVELAPFCFEGGDDVRERAETLRRGAQPSGMAQSATAVADHFHTRGVVVIEDVATLELAVDASIALELRRGGSRVAELRVHYKTMSSIIELIMRYSLILTVCRYSGPYSEYEQHILRGDLL